MAGQVYKGNELGSGITTELRLDDAPPRLVVESLAYEGGFRGSDLRAGDSILGIDGVPIPRMAVEQIRVEGPRMPGQYQESQRWADAGRKEGDTLRLTVRRKSPPQGYETLEVRGTLGYARSYRGDDNSVLLCENGPGAYERDGFDEAWPSWLDKLGQQIRAIACFDRFRPGLTTRYELQTLLEQEARVKLLGDKYPGAFARAVASDYEAAVQAMRGERFTLTEADLAYRKADEARVEEVATAARAAWRAIRDALAGEIIPAFPAEHPVYGKRESVVGKCVLLEGLSTRQWVSEAGHGYMAAGSDSDGWYFLDMEGEGAQRMLEALRRYQKLVSGRIREEYTLLARILPDARVLVMNESGHWGLQVELLAAFIGDALAVDVRGEARRPPFAGEEALLATHAEGPADGASPKEVLEAMIAAIKADDLALWKSLFADWLVRANPDGSPQVCYRMQSPQDDDFERSRSSFAGRLWGARVAWVGDVREVTSGAEYEGAARVEEVEAEIDHIGSFDGEYRSFMDVTVHRFWTLQRINGGPWRVASLQPI